MGDTNNIFPTGSFLETLSQPLSQEAVMYFGQMVLHSFAPQKRYTVAEWIDHVIDSKESAGRKKKTVKNYHYHSIRIKQMIGDRMLGDIQPSDISDVLNALKHEKVIAEPRAVLRSDIDAQAFLNREALSKSRLATNAGISQSTVDLALKRRRILMEKAQAICSVLHIDFDDMFEIVLIDKPLSQSTLDDYRRFLNIIFSAAQRELQIIYNPVTRTERPARTHKQKKVKTLQLEEVKQVLAAAEKEPIEKKCLIHLFLITGGRLGEICGLRWSRVFWNHNTILIDHQVVYLPGEVYTEDSTKTGQDRLVRMPNETMDLLREYKSWQDIRRTKMGERWVNSDYIFTSRSGDKVSPATICGYIKRFQDKYDLPPLHPHKFRHTHASILLYSGMDIVRVSKRLGHLDVSTTLDYYAHLIMQADLESAECVGDIMYRTTSLPADCGDSIISLLNI